MGIYSGRPLATTRKREDISALWVAIQHIGVRLCPPKNILVGKVGLVILRHIADGKERTLSVWHFLKLGGMLGKEGQRAVIPLKNGRNLKRNTRTAVLYVASERNLLKTISSHYQKVAQILFLTFNHYAVIVIAKSGSIKQDYFNIYQNPKLKE